MCIRALCVHVSVYSRVNNPYDLSTQRPELSAPSGPQEVLLGLGSCFLCVALKAQALQGCPPVTGSADSSSITTLTADCHRMPRDPRFSKLIKLCPLNLCSFSYVSHISIKWFKRSQAALASVAQLVGACPVDRKVVGSIPNQGTYPGCGFDPWSGCVGEGNQSMFLSFPPFLSL